MQNHTWPPLRWPKMVPITIVREGRGGTATKGEALGEEAEEEGSRLCRGSARSERCFLLSSRSSRREVLRRFLGAAAGGGLGEVRVWVKQGRRKRRRALAFVMIDCSAFS